MKLFVVGVAIIICSSVAHAGYVPVSSSLGINGASNLDSDDFMPGTAVTQTQGAATNPLTVQYTRSLTNGLEVVNESGTASAIWNSPSSGSVEWSLNVNSQGLVGGRMGFYPETQFRYEFIADANGIFTLGGSASGNHGGIGIFLTSATAGVVVQDAVYNPVGLSTGFYTGTSSQLLTWNVASGQSYAVSFLPFFGLSCPHDLINGGVVQCQLQPDTLNLDAHMTFGLQAVPIPAALWLLASALGVLGWMRRKSGSRSS